MLNTKIKNVGEFTPKTFEGMVSMGNRQIIMEAWFQLGHFFAEMDRATIFRPLLMSEKTRFTSIPLTIQLFYEI